MNKTNHSPQNAQNVNQPLQQSPLEHVNSNAQESLVKNFEHTEQSHKKPLEYKEKSFAVTPGKKFEKNMRKDIRSFEEGLAKVQTKDRKYCFVNQDYIQVSDYFDDTWGFTGGFAIVKKDDQRFLINTNFQQVSDPYRYIDTTNQEGIFKATTRKEYFLINTKNNTISDAFSHFYDFMEDGLALAEKNDKMFLINTDFEQVSDSYDYLSRIDSDVYQIKKDKKTFFANKNFEPISDQYDDIDIKDDIDVNYDTGIAKVEKNKQYAYINFSGEQLCPWSQRYYNFDEDYGVAIGKNAENKYFLIDQTYRQTGDTYDYIGSFHDGYAVSKKDGHAFYIDTTGIQVSDNFAVANNFIDGVAQVTDENGDNFLINTNFDQISNTYTTINDFNEQGVAIAEDNGKQFLIHKYGEELCGGYDLIDGYDLNKHGVTQVKNNGRWFLINKDGETISKKYDYIGNFFYGFAARAQKNGYYYLIDTNGDEIFWKCDEIQFNRASQYAKIKTRDHYFVINRDWEISEAYDDIKDLGNGELLVTKDGKMYTIDSSFNIIDDSDDIDNDWMNDFDKNSKHLKNKVLPRDIKTAKE